MNSTPNVLRKGLGTFEYAKLLDNANQIRIFGEPIKELSREELLAALVFTMQSKQEQSEQPGTGNDYKRLDANKQIAGLW
jgi:hypothetical protein